MKLKELLKDVEYELLQGTQDTEIKDLVYDSRKASESTAFFALTGFRLDGHDYVQNAIANGCRVLIVEHSVTVPQDITVIKLADTRRGLAKVSRTFFNYPDKELITIGITGTKGKTTTSWTIRQIINNAGYKCGLIGTMGIFYLDEHFATNNTTPEAYEVYSHMRKMLDLGVTYLVMEVSSQSLKLNRLKDIMFDYAVFTNLSPDHIGEYEHASYEEYVECKSRLFHQCKTAVINIDDKEHSKMIKGITCPIVTFGTREDANYRLVSWRGVSKPNFLGLTMQVSGEIVDNFLVSMPGDFSAMNALCAISVCSLLKIETAVMKKTLEQLSVKGRLEAVKVSNKFHVLIDYAYQGIAMKSIIDTIRKTNPDSRIIVLFGCGGNRSRQRRYDMGRIAAKEADFTILTTDNSRDEDPEEIINDILIGYKEVSAANNYAIILDRKEAIHYAITHAKEEDVVLILGKGHEVYQEIKGVKYPFDERVVIKDILASLTKEERKNL